MAEQRPLMLPRQTDAEAANSATPDTDRQPSWDDEGWDSYLYAVDLDYRVDWDFAHGVPREEVRDMIDDWHADHDEDEDEDLDEDGPDRDWETCFDCAGVGCDYCGDTGVIPRQHVAVGGKDPRFAEWEEEGRRAEEEASG